VPVRPKFRLRQHDGSGWDGLRPHGVGQVQPAMLRLRRVRGSIWRALAVGELSGRAKWASEHGGT